MSRWLIPVGVVVVLLVSGLAFSSVARTADPLKPAQWEYKAMHYSDLVALGGSKDASTAPIRFAELGLNKLGEDGWELVEVTGGISDRSYYLKRPKAR
jgi:hypothetical protein